MLPRVAIIVLNYNTPEMTDALAAYLEADLEYPNKRLYVVDNGSAGVPARTTHRLAENLGFTRGMHAAWRIAADEEPFDAYWFLNSDVGFEYGRHVLRDLVDVLFAREEYAQIAPQMNSPHRFMEQAQADAQRVPYLEPTATLVKAAALERLGFWDLDLTLGWGVDYDFGYRVRAAGLANILTSRARITHKEHKSIGDYSGYVNRAAAEMHGVLTRKYGPGWERIMRMRRVLPVVLTCCRDVDVTARFAASFRQAAHAMEAPRILVDLSASPRVTPAYVEVLASLRPAWIEFHPAEPQMSVYDSVQEAATLALGRVLPEAGEHDVILFLEDDVVFCSRFADLLADVSLPEDAGFLTLYSPGSGYGMPHVPADRFYGTQAVLFSRRAAADIAAHQHDMQASIPPGYDIRWSRWLAQRGFRLYATPASWVQHIGWQSRLHGSASHTSAVFQE